MVKTGPISTMVSDLKKRAVTATGIVTKDLQVLEASKIKTDLSSLKNEFLALKTLVTQLGSNANTDVLSILGTEIDKIKSDLSTQYQTDIANITSQLTSDGSSITGFTSVIQTIQSNLSTLATTITQHGNVIAQLQSMLTPLILQIFNHY